MRMSRTFCMYDIRMFGIHGNTYVQFDCVWCMSLVFDEHTTAVEAD